MTNRSIQANNQRSLLNGTSTNTMSQHRSSGNSSHKYKLQIGTGEVVSFPAEVVTTRSFDASSPQPKFHSRPAQKMSSTPSKIDEPQEVCPNSMQILATATVYDENNKSNESVPEYDGDSEASTDSNITTSSCASEGKPSRLQHRSSHQVINKSMQYPGCLHSPEQLKMSHYRVSAEVHAYRFCNELLASGEFSDDDGDDDSEE